MHSLLWVQYGVGSRTDEKVLVMNSRGGTTSTSAYVSYHQCPEGWSQQSLEEKNNPEHKENEGWHCIVCPAGTYTDSENSEMCHPCEPGSYAPTNGSTSCLLAPAGSIAREMGSRASELCPAGTKSITDGGKECAECEPDFFNTDDGSSRMFSYDHRYHIKACNQNQNRMLAM